MSDKDSKKDSKKDLTVADVICRWYTCAVIGFVIGQNSGDGLTGLIGFIAGGFVGWLLEKYQNKKE